MNNKNNNIAIRITVLFQAILIITTITSLVTKQWRNFFMSLLAIAILIAPFIITYIANKKEIMLPASFQLIAILFIFSAQYLGEIIRFYDRFWWWDILLHAVSGAYGLIIGACLLDSIKQSIFFKTVFAFCFSITLGTLWEMYEFTGDVLFKTTMIKGGLNDTATDLLVKIAAAFITSIIYIAKEQIS